LRQQHKENARLRAALAAPSSAGLAAGVLIFRYGIDEERAFGLLARWSDSVHMKPEAFAASVVEIAARDPESLEKDLVGPGSSRFR
jgi:AmiR/NasT family two-component response regulator